MDKISDFFKELKDRASNPFISSFIISWIIFNWKIVVGLLFYKIPELKADHYASYFDLISKNTVLTQNILYPLISSFLYTFLFPIFRNIISAFNAWIKTWGENWNLKISKETNISIAKYLALKDTYTNNLKKLGETLNSENQFQLEISELKNKETELLNGNNTFQQLIQAYEEFNSLMPLRGLWKILDLTKAGAYLSYTHIDIQSNLFKLYEGNEVNAQYIVETITSNFKSKTLILSTKNNLGVKEKAVFFTFSQSPNNRISVINSLGESFTIRKELFDKVEEEPEIIL